MASSRTFVSVSDERESICLLCQYSIKCKNAKSEFRNQGWNTLKEQALRWSKINIPFEDKIYYFTKVHTNVKDCFTASIKKVMPPTGLNKAKKVPKAVTVLKQDRRAFGTVLSSTANLEVAFKLPLTAFPLSIATLDGKLRQAPKNALRNYLIKQANSIADLCPKMLVGQSMVLLQCVLSSLKKIIVSGSVLC